MKTISISNDIVPIAEFKTSISKWFKNLKNTGHPLIITQNGKPAGVLLSPNEYDELVYRKSFLDSIRYTGRLYEIGLFADYKARTLKIFDDLDLAPKMMKRGKLNIIPELIKDRSGVASIFRKTVKKNLLIVYQTKEL